MRTAVFGSLGNIGGTIVDELLTRRHDVTAVVRRPEQAERLPSQAVPQVADATDPVAVDELAYAHDVIVSATRPRPGSESELAAVAKVLLDGVAPAKTRLVVVGGAGSLTVPGTDGRTVIEDTRYLPLASRPIAQACGDQLAVCDSHAQADWTYLSPAATLTNGPRTGSYRLGLDQLVVDAAGESRISIPDLAVALVDEVERPAHRRMRFTVAY